MPAASISNGHTGPLINASKGAANRYIGLMSACGIDADTTSVARATMGRELHVVEFWMPGGCNLRCTHCYVASWAQSAPLLEHEFAGLTSRMVHWGLKDVVVPGMEPLLRDETWHVVRAAAAAGARSIGITTNATLLKRRLSRVVESALTVLNVSLDGPEKIHNQIRGKGVYKIAMSGVEALVKASTMRVISNSTLNRHNRGSLPEIAKIAYDYGLTFAAFHPFERSAEIDNQQELSASETVDEFESIRSAFDKGNTGSVVLEVEASRLDVLLEMNDRNWFADMDLLADETGFLFFASRRECNVLLVNLMAYPHHFIRTLRVADDGGLSSCRSMAKSQWAGLGDLRKQATADLLGSPECARALGNLWREFQVALIRSGPKSLERFLAIVAAKANGYIEPSRMPSSVGEFDHA